MSAFRKLSLASAVVALMQLGACSTLDTMEADFEAAWAEPPVQVTPNEPPATATMTEESFADLERKLKGLSTDKECRTIVRTAARLIAYKPGYLPAELKLASCDYVSGDYEASRSRYLRILEAGPNAEAFEGLGHSELHLGDAAEARKYLTLANEAGSKSADVSNALGFLDDQDQQWAGAELHYRKAMELAPKSGAAFNNLGMSYMRQQRYGDAAAAFARSVQAQPALQIARLNLRIAQAMAGNVPAALSGASEGDKAVVMNNLGVAALARGDTRTARTHFQAALSHSPTFYPNAFANLELAESPARRAIAVPTPVAVPAAGVAAPTPLAALAPTAGAVIVGAEPVPVTDALLVPVAALSVVITAADAAPAAVETIVADIAKPLPVGVAPIAMTPALAGVADAVAEAAAPAVIEAAIPATDAAAAGGQ